MSQEWRPLFCYWLSDWRTAFETLILLPKSSIHLLFKKAFFPDSSLLLLKYCFLFSCWDSDRFLLVIFPLNSCFFLDFLWIGCPSQQMCFQISAFNSCFLYLPPFCSHLVALKSYCTSHSSSLIAHDCITCSYALTMILSYCDPCSFVYSKCCC